MVGGRDGYSSGETEAGKRSRQRLRKGKNRDRDGATLDPGRDMGAKTKRDGEIKISRERERGSYLPKRRWS